MRIFFLFLYIGCFGISSVLGAAVPTPPTRHTDTELNNTDFLIDTSSWSATQGGNITSGTPCITDPSTRQKICTKQSLNDSEYPTINLLTNIMNKLMIGISLVTVLLIVIGGGCLIFSGGSDGLKTKGKNILIAGILSLSVAMCSAIIINIIVYILY